MKKIICICMSVVMMICVGGCGKMIATHKIECGAVSGDPGVKNEYSDICDGAFDDYAGGEEFAFEPGASENGGSSEEQNTSGMLTAGEWKDLDNYEFWSTLLNKNEWYRLMESRNLFANKMIKVNVIDKEGNPCFNAYINLLDKDDNVIYSGRSDLGGNAYLFYDIDNNKEQAVSVEVNGIKTLLDGKSEIKVKIEEFGTEFNYLDIMFMIDTTGSMGDELNFLQTEVEDVINRVANTQKTLSIRMSVNFYRDKGDRYIVRDNKFYTDIDECIKQLKEQEADGGGDYPEAVHTAMDNAVNEHQWRENAVKLCFLVLDAPPHNETEIEGINEQLQSVTEKAADKGIRIIPVASSGVDTETEFLMRSFAVMTGGTYIFLTDHSGIGESHLEPTVGEYEVKKLNELLYDVILNYCGMKTVNVVQ